MAKLLKAVDDADVQKAQDIRDEVLHGYFVSTKFVLWIDRYTTKCYVIESQREQEQLCQEGLG